MIQPRRRQPVVHFPAELEYNDYLGAVYGYYHADSNEYNIVAWGDASQPDATLITLGVIADASDDGQDVIMPASLIGVRTEQGLAFTADGRRCRRQPYDLLKKIFSRNTGILETDVMLDKCAIISGVGSVGSLVALELARAGVGAFLLVDNDTLAYHNLCRHQCGRQDVGKFKVQAVKERLHQINPTAHVETYPSILEEVNKEMLDTFGRPGSIIVGCADNRACDVYASRLACLYNIPFVSIGLWRRAFAGEIFYVLPGQMPCYACVFEDAAAPRADATPLSEAVAAEEGEASSPVAELSGRVSMSRRFYLDQEDLADATFEPGISTDISFVTLIAIKLVIDLLNRETPGYVPHLLNHLAQYTWVCNTSDPRIGGERAEIFAYPLQVTTSLVVDYRPPCPPCKYLP